MMFLMRDGVTTAFNMRELPFSRFNNLADYMRIHDITHVVLRSSGLCPKEVIPNVTVHNYPIVHTYYMLHIISWGRQENASRLSFPIHMLRMQSAIKSALVLAGNEITKSNEQQGLVNIVGTPLPFPLLPILLSQMYKDGVFPRLSIRR